MSASKGEETASHAAPLRTLRRSVAMRRALRWNSCKFSGAPNWIRTRVSAAITFSPGISRAYTACLHKKDDATKTRSSRASLVQIEAR